MLLQMARFHSFWWLSNIHCIYIPHLHYLSSFDAHLGSFHSLAIVDNAAVNIGVHVPLQICSFVSCPFAYLVVQLLDCRVVLFLTYWGTSIVFSREAAPVCIPTNSVKRVPPSPHPNQHVLFSVLLILAILTGVRWYLIVILVCSSLMMSDVEHIFLCLLAIWMSSGKMSVPVLAHF